MKGDGRGRVVAGERGGSRAEGCASMVEPHTSGCITQETAAVQMRTISRKKWMMAKTTSWGTSWAQLRMPCPSSAVPATCNQDVRRMVTHLRASQLRSRAAGCSPRDMRSHISSSTHSVHSAVHHSHSPTRPWRSPAGTSQCGLPSWYIRTASASRRSSRSSAGGPLTIELYHPVGYCLRGSMRAVPYGANAASKIIGKVDPTSLVGQ